MVVGIIVIARYSGNFLFLWRLFLANKMRMLQEILLKQIIYGALALFQKQGIID